MVIEEKAYATLRGLTTIACPTAAQYELLKDEAAKLATPLLDALDALERDATRLRSENEALRAALADAESRCATAIDVVENIQGKVAMYAGKFEMEKKARENTAEARNWLAAQCAELDDAGRSAEHWLKRAETRPAQEGRGLADGLP